MFSSSITLPTTNPSIQDIQQSIQNYATKFNTESRFLNELPTTVHLLSLQTRTNVTSTKERFTVLRLQHIFETQESLIHSKPVTIYPRGIFSDYFVNNIIETTLSMNSPLQTLNFTKII